MPCQQAAHELRENTREASDIAHLAGDVIGQATLEARAHEPLLVLKQLYTKQHRRREQYQDGKKSDGAYGEILHLSGSRSSCARPSRAALGKVRGCDH